MKKSRKRAYTVAEAAEVLGKPQSTLYSLLRRAHLAGRQIPFLASKDCGSWTIPMWVVDEFAEGKVDMYGTPRTQAAA